MSNRDEYVRKLQEKLGEWNAEIDKLTCGIEFLGPNFLLDLNHI